MISRTYFDWSGRITRIESGPASALPPPVLNDLWAEGAFDAEEYYIVMGDVPIVIQRPSLAFDRTEIIADGADTATIVGLPNPTGITVNGDPMVVTDGEFTFATDIAGEHFIEVDGFPYRRLVAIITAHEAGP
jgi:hypothetical protein